MKPLNAVLIIFTLFSFTHAQAIEVVGSVEIEGAENANFISMQGNYVYLTTGSNNPQVIIADVSDVENPVVVGQLGFGYPAVYESVPVGDVLFIAGGGYIKTIDISDKANPADLGLVLVDASSTFERIIVEDNFAYLLSSAGFFVMDVSDPVNMTEAGSWRNRAGIDMKKRGDYIYMVRTQPYPGFVVLDVSDLENIGAISALSVWTHGTAVALVGDYAYAAFSDLDNDQNGIASINISDPASPSLQDEYLSYDMAITSVNSFWENIYLTDANWTGIGIYNAQDGELNELGQFHTDEFDAMAKDAVICGNYAYLASETHLVILDCEDALHVPENNSQNPELFVLNPAYPNPFNSQTRISFSIQNTAPASLVIYDLSGVEVSRPMNGICSAGSYDIQFDASNLPTGVYFAQLISGSQIQTQRLLLLK